MDVNSSVEKFRRDAKLCVDYICEYRRNVHKKTVFPRVRPGYLRALLPAEAPTEPEDFKEVLDDVEKYIMPGTLHWQHPNFYAYFPGGNSFPNILGDMLSTAFGGVGFSWTAQPSSTELENLVMDWYGRALGLPESFIFEDSQCKGGGSIQNSASDAIFNTIIAARHTHLEAAKCYLTLDELKKGMKPVHPGTVIQKLICYTTREAHSCVQKGANLALCSINILEPNEQDMITGDILENAIMSDLKKGLMPFYCCAVFGSTNGCALDDLKTIGPICRKYKIWMHVDGAYGGNAWILPEMDYLKEGLQYADSIDINPYKLMLGAIDLDCLWVKNLRKYKQCFIINATYIISEFDNRDEYEIDYRHYGVSLSRRMRALKLWLLFRYYGITGLQKHVRNLIACAKYFAECVRKDARFEVCNDVKMALVCFRQKSRRSEENRNSPGELSMNDKYNLNLLIKINQSKAYHLVPCTLRGMFVLRFSVNYEFATTELIDEAWKFIQSKYVESLDVDLVAHESRISFDEASKLAMSRLIPEQTYKDMKKHIKNEIDLSFGPILIPEDKDVEKIMHSVEQMEVLYKKDDKKDDKNNAHGSSFGLVK